MRWSYSPSVGGDSLEEALLNSPDDAVIQVPPAWVEWAAEFLEVRFEWATTWYAMARVKGVCSRVVGPMGEALVSGDVVRAKGNHVGKNAGDEWATGVAMVRGWARTRALVGGRQEGGVTPALKYLLRRLRQSKEAQYLFVATHAEGRAAVQEAVAAAGGHVMLRVDKGRMGRGLA